jgi:G3E family GTPase
MDILIISGFLGSGKTTLLRHIASEFEARFPLRKMAIIENEVGKVGIDGALLKNDELYVREINSGCICCSLRADLLETLVDLERDYAPDLVVLEPSGVAGPRQLMQSLRDYAGEIDNRRIVSIIDASRILKIPDMTIPIVADGISIADQIIINKTDLVEQSCLEQIREKVNGIRADAPVIEISAINNRNLDVFLDAVFSDDYSGASEDGLFPSPQADASTVTNATVHSGQVPVRFAREFSSEHIRDEIVNLIEKIASKLEESGCSMIGHLKAIVDADKQGLLMISTTSFEHKPHALGTLNGGTRDAMLTINAIVYGIDKTSLRNLIDKQLAAARIRQ